MSRWSAVGDAFLACVAAAGAALFGVGLHTNAKALDDHPCPEGFCERKSNGRAEKMECTVEGCCGKDGLAWCNGFDDGLTLFAVGLAMMDGLCRRGLLARLDGRLEAR